MPASAPAASPEGERPAELTSRRCFRPMAGTAGRLLVCLAVLVVVLARVTPARAQQAGELVWERYDVLLDVQRDGSILVSETQEVHFLSGSWRNGGRSIPLGRVGNISDVKVFELAGGSREELPVSSTRDSEELRVSWLYRRAAAGEVRTFQLTYKAHDAVRVYRDNQQVRWIAVPERRRFAVERSSVSLRLPGDVAAEDLRLDSYPSRLGGTQVPVPGGAEFHVGQVPKFRGFEVRARFPAGTVDAAAPEWQRQADREDVLRETTAPRLLWLGLYTFAPHLGGAALLLVGLR